MQQHHTILDLNTSRVVVAQQMQQDKDMYHWQIFAEVFREDDPKLFRWDCLGGLQNFISSLKNYLDGPLGHQSPRRRARITKRRSTLRFQARVGFPDAEC